MINKSHSATNYSSFLSSITSSATIKVALLVFSCFLSISLLKSHNYAMDETLFHYPNLLNYYNNGLAATFNKDYSAANTPLPYIILAGISKIFGPSIILARIITACFSFAAFILSSKILSRLGIAPFYSLVTLFYPYFFLNSFVFYAINYGLFFFVLTLYLLFCYEHKTYWINFLTGLALSMAVLCQQFYLVIFPAVIIIRGWQYFFKKEQGDKNNFIVGSMFFLLPVLLPFWLFIQWKGLVHSNFRVHAIALFPSDLTGIFIIIGFYFWPYIFQSFSKKDVWKLCVAIVPASILFFWFKPIYNDYNGSNIFNGIVYHLANLLSGENLLVASFLMLFIITLGIMVLIKLAGEQKTNFELLLFASSVLLIVAFSMNAILGERHLLPLIFLMYFLVLPKLKINLLNIYLCCISLLGIGYYSYWIFMKYT